MNTPTILETISLAHFRSIPKIRIDADECFIFKISYSEKLNDTLWNDLIALLTDEMIHQTYQYKRWQDQHNFLLGKVLVYIGYHCLTGLSLDFENYKKDKGGKPYLYNGNLKFNISHTNKTVVCAYSKDEIGIDIEQIVNINYEDFENVLTPEEKSIVKDQGIQKMYEFWTKKEAVAKNIGQGLNISFKNINSIYDKINCQGAIFEIQKYIIGDIFCSIALKAHTTKKIRWIEIKI